MNKDLHNTPGGPAGIHEDLLVKYLLGEVSPEEHASVSAWLAADAANQHYFEHFQLIWRESRRLGNELHARDDDQQTEAAWQKFRQRIHKPSPLHVVKSDPSQTAQSEEPSMTKSRILRPWTRIAAILILVAGITAISYLVRRSAVVPDKLVASNAAVLTDTLPDGSLITLNKRSNISYPATFKKDRTVKLKGEAFFKIAPDKEKPFHVYTNGVTITVLGTSFNVRDKGSVTEIIVETGLLRVTDSLHSILLRPSERLVIHQGDTTLSKDSAQNELYKYYSTKKFVCDDTPLSQLAASLEEAYGVKVLIPDPALARQKINATFNDESLEQILTLIRETFRIRVTRSGDVVTLQP